MKKLKRDNAIQLAMVLTAAISVSGCFHDDDDDDMMSMAEYEVAVTNATNHQPLTPLAVVAHNSSYHPWMLGSAASTGLEMLAEGGDVTQFLADADANTHVVATAMSTSGPFGPGATETVMLTVEPNSNLQISIASMLANTNDAFTGAANVDVGSLMPGESMALLSHVYDAGTEANTETAGTMPGPAAGGEGFNAARDDTDFVSIHGGVVTADDGLATSALDESHRWLGAASKITITRVQ